MERLEANSAALRTKDTYGHGTFMAGIIAAKDTVALWVGMHGLAHQRISTRVFPWPDDIDEWRPETGKAVTGQPGDQAF